jgi:hypothetical protein
MPDDLISPDRSWVHKFADAFRGMKAGVRGQSSFFVHFFIAAVVVAAGAVLQVSLIEWCLLLLCIAGVLTADFEDRNNGLNHPVTGTSAAGSNVWQHAAMTYDQPSGTWVQRASQPCSVSSGVKPRSA